MADAILEAFRALDITIDDAINAYQRHLVEKGNKATPILDTIRRLRMFFTDPTAQLAKLTPATCSRLYESPRTRRGSVVAPSLGHAKIRTTLESYARPEAVTGAKQKRPLAVLNGGLERPRATHPDVLTS